MNWGPLIIGDEVTSSDLMKLETENVKIMVTPRKLTPFC